MLSRDIFVSYAHEDEAICAKLCAELACLGVSTWRDKECLALGASLPGEVVRALDCAVGFILLHSRHVKESGWVQLELGAALVRRAENPSFPLIPIILDDSAVPAMLRSLYYLRLNRSQLNVSSAAIRIKAAVQQVSADVACSAYETIFKALRDDQFLEDAGSSSYGGWGKSYTEYLHVAFPEGRPEHVAGHDSISVTHWIIRGLLSLRRLWAATHHDQRLGGELEQSLVLARKYLHRHFDGWGAGIIHYTTQVEKISRDPRHSATFIKALLALKGENVARLKRAADYALSRYEDDGDGRLASAAEIYHLARLVEAQSHLRPEGVTKEMISRLCNSVEQLLSQSVFDAEVEGGHVPLFNESRQPHMALYYSWWVLDACGDLLLQFGDSRTRSMIKRILAGLPSLGQGTEDGIGFPLVLGGGSDIGMSAQIGDILLRLAPVECADSIDLVFKFVTARMNADSTDAYPFKFLLWAVPVFLERYAATQLARKVLPELA